MLGYTTLTDKYSDNGGIEMAWWKIYGLLISLVTLVYAGMLGLPTGKKETEELKYALPQVSREVTLAGRKVGKLNQVELMKQISQLAVKLKTEPQPAFRFQGEINAGTPGQKIDVTKTLVTTLQAKSGAEIRPVYKPEPPLIKEKHLAEEVKLKLATGEEGEISGHFTTYLTNNQPPRRTNIELAVEKLNNRYLQSGEQFSFNDLIGKPTRVEGYQPAPVIINGQLEPAVGGGICQVSSTLHAAVKKAGLKILERHSHSKPVDYIQSGQDAAIAPGEKDFQFKNTTEGQLKLKGAVIDRYLAIYLLQVRETDWQL